MINNSQTGRDRHYFEQLLKKVEQESRSAAAEQEDNLLSEDPLGVNYARWATEEEMKSSLVEIPMDAGEADTAGVPLLCRDGMVYADPSDSHTLIIGASGSKKTRLFILPTILTLMKAGESMIVTDPKAELYERTSGRLRENGYEVLCINFRDDSRQNCWNPLKAPREFFQNGKFDLAVGLLNDFSTIAVPSDSRGGDPFWDDSSRSAFMGFLLLMFLLAEDPEEINIRGLLRMRNVLFNSSSVRESPFHELYKQVDPGSLAASYLSSIAIAPERTLSSILATLDTHLIKFIMRPDLTDMLCHDDIDFHALGHEKTAVFLVMPDEKETYHGLISIFIQQCYESLIFEAQKLPGKTLPRRVNFLLDEFSSLPPIKEFPAMIAAARSRNIRFDIVVQSEKQLRSRYREEADTIKGNCNNWLFLYSRELETLEELCRLCGSQKSGNPLITPSRLQRLDKEKGEALVIHGRKYPFLSRLDDVNEYDHEQFLPAYHKETSGTPLRVFMVDELLKNHSKEWFQARLAQNTVRQAQVEEEERQKALNEFTLRLNKVQAELEKTREENARLQERADLCRLDIQTEAIPSDHPVLTASRRWYEAAHPHAPGDLGEYACSVLPPAPIPDPLLTKERQAELADFKPLLPQGEIPLNFVSLASELNRESIALLGGDGEVLDRAAHQVYRRTLAGGQSIPIFFDMRDLVEDWNLLTQRRKDTTLLTLLLARQLFGGQMPDMPEIPAGADTDEIPLPDVPEDLMASARLLREEFSRTPAGMPRYLVILNRMELAPFRTDAIWQSWELGSLPNVRLFVTTTDQTLMEENCIHTFRTKDGRAPAQIFTYFFHEATNEVLAKQGASPRILLEVTPCSRS